MRIVEVRLLKKWADRSEGTVVALGEPKADALIARGIAEEVIEADKVSKKTLIVETATIDVSTTETAMRIPVVKKSRGRQWTGK